MCLSVPLPAVFPLEALRSSPETGRRSGDSFLSVLLGLVLALSGFHHKLPRISVSPVMSAEGVHCKRLPCKVTPGPRKHVFFKSHLSSISIKRKTSEQATLSDHSITKHPPSNGSVSMKNDFNSCEEEKALLPSHSWSNVK